MSSPLPQHQQATASRHVSSSEYAPRMAMRNRAKQWMTSSSSSKVKKDRVMNSKNVNSSVENSSSLENNSKMMNVDDKNAVPQSLKSTIGKPTTKSIKNVINVSKHPGSISRNRHHRRANSESSLDEINNFSQHYRSDGESSTDSPSRLNFHSKDSKGSRHRRSSTQLPDNIVSSGGALQFIPQQPPTQKGPFLNKNNSPKRLVGTQSPVNSKTIVGSTAAGGEFIAVTLPDGMDTITPNRQIIGRSGFGHPLSPPPLPAPPSIISNHSDFNSTATSSFNIRELKPNQKVKRQGSANSILASPPPPVEGNSNAKRERGKVSRLAQMFSSRVVPKPSQPGNNPRNNIDMLHSSNTKEENDDLRNLIPKGGDALKKNKAVSFSPMADVPQTQETLRTVSSPLESRKARHRRSNSDSSLGSIGHRRSNSEGSLDSLTRFNQSLQSNPARWESPGRHRRSKSGNLPLKTLYSPDQVRPPHPRRDSVETGSNGSSSYVGWPGTEGENGRTVALPPSNPLEGDMDQEVSRWMDRESDAGVQDTESEEEGMSDTENDVKQTASINRRTQMVEAAVIKNKQNAHGFTQQGLKKPGSPIKKNTRSPQRWQNKQYPRVNTLKTHSPSSSASKSNNSSPPGGAIRIDNLFGSPTKNLSPTPSPHLLKSTPPPSDPWDIDSQSSAPPSSPGASSRSSSFVNRRKPEVQRIDTSASEKRLLSSGRIRSPRARQTMNLSKKSDSNSEVAHSEASSHSQPPTEALLATLNNYKPMPRPVNGMNVKGFSGFMNRTSDVPNLMDDESVVSSSTRATSVYDTPTQYHRKGLRTDIKVKTDMLELTEDYFNSNRTLNSPRQKKDATQLTDGEGSDIFDGISSVGAQDGDHMDEEKIPQQLTSTTDPGRDRSEWERFEKETVVSHSSASSQSSLTSQRLKKIALVAKAKKQQELQRKKYQQQQKVQEQPHSHAQKNTNLCQKKVAPISTTFSRPLAESTKDTQHSPRKQQQQHQQKVQEQPHSYAQKNTNPCQKKVAPISTTFSRPLPESTKDTQHSPRKNSVMERVKLLNAQKRNKQLQQKAIPLSPINRQTTVLSPVKRNQQPTVTSPLNRMTTHHPSINAPQSQTSYDKDSRSRGSSVSYHSDTGSYISEIYSDMHSEMEDSQYCDLSEYYIEPTIVRKLVRKYRKLCNAQANSLVSYGLASRDAEDAKKAFALFEMRSRIMETDIERGLARQGGTNTVDDLVTTQYNMASMRIRDAIIVSKAWRDGASPRDITTAALLTRRSTHSYFIKRSKYSDLGSTSSFSDTSIGDGSGSIDFSLEEVQWSDDCGLLMMRCPSLGPRCMRGFEMFTIGDCQSLLLKLANERCVQLNNELKDAKQRQLEAEEAMNEEVAGDFARTGHMMTDAEETYLAAMEEVKTISKTLARVEKSFQLVRDRIARLISKYETMLVKIEDSDHCSDVDGDNRSDISSYCSSDENSFTDDYHSEEEDLEKQHLSKRAQRAEFRAEVAAREAMIAKEEAERIRVEKQRELENLQNRLAELEKKATVERERSENLVNKYEKQLEMERQSAVSGMGRESDWPTDAPKTLKHLSDKSPTTNSRDIDNKSDAARSLIKSVASDRDQTKIDNLKAKFRSRHADRVGKGPPCNRHGAVEKVSVSKLAKSFQSREGGVEDKRLSGEEMFQHVDFYERALKAVSNKY